MKKTSKLIAIVLILFNLNQGSAQIELALKGGIHSYDINATNLDSLNFKLKNAAYGFHIGGHLRLGLANFYVEPGILLNSISAEYESGDSLNGLLKENYLNLDIPIQVGMNLALFDFHIGPVIHYRLSSYDELLAVNEYTDKLDNLFYGIQLGTAINLGSMRIGLSYESNFNGKDYQANSTDIKLIDRNSRFLLTLGYSLIGK